MRVQIRTIRSEDQQAVIDLHWNHYWRSHCLILNQDFYKWQFVSYPDPAPEKGDQSIVAVNENEELLSYLGLVPMPVFFRRSRLNGAHLITWLTAPSARGQGVGLKLMTHVTEKYDFLFGRSVTPAALAIYQQLGFRYFKHCSRWIAILDPDMAISLAVNPSDLSIKRAKARAVSIDSAAKFTISDQPPPRVGNLSESVHAGGVAFIRTDEFLKWRYQQHPFYDYKFLFIGDPEIPDGLAVLRLEQVAGRTGTALRVVEFIAPHARQPGLAKAVLEYGIENHCAYADLFGMSEKYVSGFLASGGYDAREEENLQLPYLLQPWDSEIEPPGLLFYGRRGVANQLGMSPIDDMTETYVSKGDGNMDWPSWVPSADGSSFAPPTKLSQAR